MRVIDPYEYENHTICTVALLGKDEPAFFKGRLILKTFFQNDNHRKVNKDLTTRYMVDTLWTETSRVLLRTKGIRLEERKDYAVLSYKLLGDPYLIVYNRATRVGIPLAWLHDQDSKACGPAVLMKKDNEGQPSLLTEEEARKAEKALKAISL